jgi:hypothetical protein
MFSLRIRYCVLGVMAFMAARAALVSADPQDDIKAGLQKLADAPNYTWSTKSENAGGGGFGSGTTDGKVQKDGLTYVKMNRRNTDTEVYIKGDKIAVKNQDGTWQTLDEAISAADDGNGGFNPMRMMGRMFQNYRTPVTLAQGQLDKLTNIQKTDDGYSGDLSPDAAKAVLNPFSGRPATTNPDDNNNAPQIDVSDAKASVTFSIQDGAVTKIVMHVTGTVSFNGNDRDVDRTSTTDFTNVGSTTIDVPDDAKAKLGA